MSGFIVQVVWSYGMSPLIVAYVERNNVSEDRIKVISETEIIILNQAEV